MKLLILLTGICIGIIATDLTKSKATEPCELNEDAKFILRTVENDTIIQRMILDANFRNIVKRKIKFSK